MQVQYKKINDHYNLAQKHGDAHAQFFLGNAITAVVRCTYLFILSFIFSATCNFVNWIESNSYVHVVLEWQSEKIRVVSHHLTHLKLVESDKHAIKEFDRRLPFELEDYSMAAAVESTIPARYCCS
jgi:hypothetical protein